MKFLRRFCLKPIPPTTTTTTTSALLYSSRPPIQDEFAAIYPTSRDQEDDVVSRIQEVKPVERPNEVEAVKRRRLLWESRKRGILETDLLLGTFIGKLLFCWRLGGDGLDRVCHSTIHLIGIIRSFNQLTQSIILTFLP